MRKLVYQACFKHMNMTHFDAVLYRFNTFPRALDVGPGVLNKGLKNRGQPISANFSSILNLLLTQDQTD